MNKEELINMIDEIIFDYAVTGGIMPNTLDKAKRLINYSHPTETTKVSTNKKAKEVCGTCIRYNTCKKYVMYNDNACIIYDKQTG